MKNIIELLRTSVRPVVTFVLIGAMVAIAVILVRNFADAEMARQALMGIGIASTAAMSFWFGSRKASK